MARPLISCRGKTGESKNLCLVTKSNILVQFPPICLIELAKPETIFGVKLGLVPLSNLGAFL